MKMNYFFILLSNFCFAQTTYPTDYFRPPLDIPLTISGNFGELRSNHFHAGLDFRTEQRENMNIYAAADGYVSRIKISSFGYGKAIYISHPNGYTTVYGHLNRGNATIEKYIKTQHYKERSFEIDVFPKPNELVVSKGDFIALSGNTGGSGGPHLHFEIRDSKTEKTINPLHFGFNQKMPDSRLPQLNAIMVYPISENAVVNESQQPIAVNLSLQKDGTYLSEKIRAVGKIGFSINAYDLIDKSYSKNGLYKVQSFNNGKPTFGYQFDTFSFDEGKHINGLLDYPRFIATGSRFQKLFAKNLYNLSILQTNADNGIINVVPNLSQNYRIEISDFNDNKIVINIPIIYDTNKITAGSLTQKTKFNVKSKIDNIYSKDNVTVNVPANTFYEDLFLKFEVGNDTLHFAEKKVAVQNSVLVNFEKFIESDKKSKTFIATLDGNKIIYNKTKNKENEYSCYTKNLGTLFLKQDLDKPLIFSVNIPKDKIISKQKTIDIGINDTLSGIKEYNGFINGDWVLFEYDFKVKKMYYYLSDGLVKEGNNDLKIVVTDNVGNSAIFETSFVYKIP